MNQLTNEEIAKVFAMYMYSKIINVDTKLKYILNPYQLNYIKYFNEGAYKLLLKPLSSISDEDAISVCEIIVACVHMIAQFEITEYDDKYKKVTCYNKQGEEYGGHVYVYNDGNITWDYHNKDKYDGFTIRILEAYDYLREKGYALPYKGQSLFELGIAIENK